MRKILVLILVLVLMSGVAHADNVTLQKGNKYGNTLSGYMDEQTGNGNGSGEDIDIRDTSITYRKHAIIMWDSLASAIPDAATITSAVCSLCVYTTYVNDSMQITAFRVLEPWTWDSSGYHHAPSWQYRVTDADQWTNVGCGAPTSSSETSEGDTLTVTSANGAWTWVEIGLSAATVQAWVDSPSVNYGVMLRGLEDDGHMRAWRRFVSPFHPDSTSRYPKLYVEYTSGASNMSVANETDSITASSFIVVPTVSNGVSLDSVCLYATADSAGKLTGDLFDDSLQVDKITDPDTDSLRWTDLNDTAWHYYLTVAYDGDATPTDTASAVDSFQTRSLSHSIDTTIGSTSLTVWDSCTTPTYGGLDSIILLCDTDNPPTTHADKVTSPTADSASLLAEALEADTKHYFQVIFYDGSTAVDTSDVDSATTASAGSGCDCASMLGYVNDARDSVITAIQNQMALDSHILAILQDSIYQADTNAAGILNANVYSISDDVTAANNAESNYDGTGYNMSLSGIGYVSNVVAIAQGAFDSLVADAGYWTKIDNRVDARLAAYGFFDASTDVVVPADTTAKGRTLTSYEYNYNNLILNSSFEWGAGDSTFLLWTRTNGTAATVTLNTTYKHTGRYGAYFYRAAVGADSAVLLSAPFPCDSGLYQWGAQTTYYNSTNEFRLILRDTAGASYDTLDLQIAGGGVASDTVRVAKGIYRVRIEAISAGDENIACAVDDIFFRELQQLMVGISSGSGDSNQVDLSGIDGIDLSGFDGTSPADCKADVSALAVQTTTDSILDSLGNLTVGIPDSTAADVSYVANNQSAYKATGFSTFDPASDFVMADSFPDAYLTGAKIGNNAIGASKLNTDAITSDELAASAIDKIWEYAVSNITSATGIGKLIMDSLQSFDGWVAQEASLGASGLDSAAVYGAASQLMQDSSIARNATAGDYKDGTVAGGGAFPVTLYAIDTSGTDVGVSGITITVRDSATSTQWGAPQNTLAGGHIAYSLDSGTYLVLGTRIGYAFPVPQYITVTDTLTDSIFGYDLTASAPSANMCRITGYENSGSGGVEGVMIKWELVIPADVDSTFLNNWHFINSQNVTWSDTSGYWYIDLVPNALIDSDTSTYYKCTITAPNGVSRFYEKIIVPNNASVDFEAIVPKEKD